MVLEQKLTWSHKNKGLEDDFPVRSGDLHVPRQFSGVYMSFCKVILDEFVTPRKTPEVSGVRFFSFKNQGFFTAGALTPPPQKRYSNTNDIVIIMIVYPTN